MSSNLLIESTPIFSGILPQSWQEPGQNATGRTFFNPCNRPAMSDSPPITPSFRSHLTLVLCTVLHAFTHAYGTLLVPLYLLMTSDLRLRGVSYASAVVAVYGLINCMLSYGAGVFADR